MRAIPNKVLGVVAIFGSLLLFFLFVFVDNYTSMLSKLNKVFVFLLMFTLVILSWLGQCLVEEPFVTLSIVFSGIYFVTVLILFFIFWGTKFIFKYIYSIINMSGLGPGDRGIFCFIIFIF